MKATNYPLTSRVVGYTDNIFRLRPSGEECDITTDLRMRPKVITESLKYKARFTDVGVTAHSQRNFRKRRLTVTSFLSFL